MGIKVFIAGFMPRKSLWERIKSLLKDKPEAFYVVVDVSEVGGSPMTVIEEFEGVAVVFASAREVKE